MQTFMARFVRRNGDQGVIYVLAASAGLALIDVMAHLGPMAHVSVRPKRRAALLIPVLPKSAGRGPRK